MLIYGIDILVLYNVDDYKITGDFGAYYMII